MFRNAAGCFWMFRDVSGYFDELQECCGMLCYDRICSKLMKIISQVEPFRLF